MKSVILFLLALFLVGTAYGQRQKHLAVHSSYFTSFSKDSVPQGWTQISKHGSTRSPTTIRSPRGIRLLGRIGGADRLELRLDSLPDHELLKLHIGFHIVGSWDGAKDDDRFIVTVDKRTVLDESFSNTIYKQSFPGKKQGRMYPARTGARNSNMLAFKFVEPGVYDGLMDATYEVEYEVRHKDSSALITLQAQLKDFRSGLENESWGLEYVYVEAETREPPASIWPVKPHPHRVYDEDIVDFKGEDERVIAGYVQDNDLNGVVEGSPWEILNHTTLLYNKTLSCSDICLMYTYVVYSDGWVNVWSNREPYGIAMWSTMLDPEELDTIRASVKQCLSQELHPEYEADDVDMHPELPHNEVILRHQGNEWGITFMGGEPPDITATLQKTMVILAEHGWEPTPITWD